MWISWPSLIFLKYAWRLPNHQKHVSFIKEPYGSLLIQSFILNFWLICQSIAYPNLNCNLSLAIWGLHFLCLATEIATILTLPRDMWFFTFYSTKPAVELWFSWRALPWLNYCASQVWEGWGVELKHRPHLHQLYHTIFTVAPLGSQKHPF